VLDVKYIISNFEEVEASLKTRGKEFDLSKIKELVNKRAELITIYEENQQKLNNNKHLMAKVDKKSQEFVDLRNMMKEISTKSKIAKSGLTTVMEELDNQILYLPNLPQKMVPIGKTEDDNVVLRHWGEKPNFDFEPKNHWDLDKKQNLLDFERGAKISGAKFTVLKGLAARMERALINLMLDTHLEKGYTEVFPPFLVNKESMIGTGQLPKFAEDAFKIEGMEYYLVPTAEVPVTNLYQNEIVLEEELPIKMMAYSACFRKEAGSAGKDTRGLIRQHQFNKVELVKLTKPEDSEKEHLALLADAEAILQKLNLHYRVVELCTGDLGFSASRCFDIEVWVPGQNKYREISSVSNFLDFQGRRAKIRYKNKETKKNQPLHTVNGSGLAIGRTLVAVWENYQQKDGSIIIPEALRPYMGNLEKIEFK
jgi:seryl-tRNA synthetase